MKRALILIAGFILSVKGFSQPVPTAEFPFTMTVEQYVEKFWDVAVAEMNRSRIPASITLAQGLLESGNGNSRLAKEGNNHFGIKCKKDWTGPSLKEDDDAPQECFRKYNTPIESYKDHSEFLMNGQRYAFLFDLDKGDYVSWAKGLKKAGYATNPRYAELLIATIEKNNLHRFDTMKPKPAEIKEQIEEKKAEQIAEKKLEINKIPAVIASLGQSYAEIAMSNDLKVLELYKYNDLKKSAEIHAGDTLYLKPKNYKGVIAFAVLMSGEDIHTISQRYAIKESRLRKYNLLNDEDEPEAGETIWLQSKRDNPVKLQIKDTTHLTKDSVYDDVIYDDPKKNLATTAPVLPEDQYDIASHGVKEDMAFIHEVRAGETLFSIAKKYNVQPEGIKMLNKLKKNEIKVGDKLIINPNQPKISPDREAVIPGYHTVSSGETLYSISKLYNTTVAELKSLNELESDTIRLGDELIVVPLNGEKPKEDKVSDNPDEPIFYMVKEKETLYSISRKFGVTENDLRTLNNILDNTVLVGQKLRIR